MDEMEKIRKINAWLNEKPHELAEGLMRLQVLGMYDLKHTSAEQFIEDAAIAMKVIKRG